MSETSIINSVVEMGFPRKRVELAYSRSNVKDVASVTEWLLSHMDEEVDTPPTEASSANSITEAAISENMAELATGTQQQKEAQSVKSIKCDDCGKLFNSQAEVEFHASKTGHEHFSESTEEKRALTEDEKREQLEKIEAKLKQRRLEREEREKQEVLEREKKRIRSGKEMLEAKQKQEDMEMKKIIEQRRREKEEDRLAKQRVREQIEADKLSRKAKYSASGDVAAPVESTTPVAPKPVQNYNEVRLQIRLTDGTQLTNTFGAKEPLSAVRVFIEMNRSDGSAPFRLIIPASRTVFTEEDYEKPLDALDLAPAAVLIVQKSS